MRKNPWPDGHKGHWWSGWPGAHCLRCGNEMFLEVALADGWYDPVTGEFDTKEHEEQSIEASRCRADEEVD